jgi:ferredoxin
MESSGFRVHVDPARCQGHNRCYSIAPDLFDLDDLGMSSEIGAGDVAAGRLDAARRAVANCPEYAIALNAVAEDAVTEDAMTEDAITGGGSDE